MGRTFTIACLLMPIALAFGTAELPPATVDLGWIKVEQTSEGWRVVQTSELTGGLNALQTNDLIVRVDNVSVVTLNALSTARMLNRLSADASAVSILRNGSQLHLHMQQLTEPLAKLVSTALNADGAAMYGKNEALPILELPDQLGHPVGITFREKWTLIHIWNTGCDPSEVAALNEIATPSPSELTIVGIAMNDTFDSVKQFSEKREPIEFLNLIGGDYEGITAKKLDYFRLKTDILVTPDAQVVFVGSGPSALGKAWSIFRQQQKSIH
jgi:hypothetical protein